MSDNKLVESDIDGRTMIVGLGKSGQSVLQFLSRHGLPLLAADTRKSPPGLSEMERRYPELDVLLGPLDGELLSSAGCIVLSPGVSKSSPAIQQAVNSGVELIGDIELFARYAKAPVIAITGSNGKSTVTTLVARMAEKAGLDVRYGGNLGTPALDLLAENEPDLYVLELSSFQLETTRTLAPVASVVLNITPDHMDRYPDLQSYADTKGGIYRDASHLIYDSDDETVCRLVERQKGFSSLLSYHMNPPEGTDSYGIVMRDGKSWICRGDEFLISTDELPVRGQHNYLNAMAALALGEASGIDITPMVETLKEFRGLPHRTEWIADHNNVVWINDSKGTNVGATEAAINGLLTDLPGDNGKIVLIAGGQGKGADFSSLQQLLKKSVRIVILMGEDAEIISNSLNGVVPELFVEDMRDAVDAAESMAQHGDMVLLSPACASLDQYSGFEERGDMFRDALFALMERAS